MNLALKQSIKKILTNFDIAVTSHRRLQALIEFENDIGSLLQLPEYTLTQLLNVAKQSRSQLKQDLFVLCELEFKRNGFFVEFGAGNGVYLSNSYLLETEFGWNGILAEPAKCWHVDLRRKRNSQIETNCVWRDSGSVLTFKEVEPAADLSTISSYRFSDDHHRERKTGKTYDVKTISLADLLDKYDAPKQIDYLSIDTEGSEYEILNSFEFDRYQFRVITCEHNFQPRREKIFKLLTGKGYIRKFVGLSKWDDWYITAK